MFHSSARRRPILALLGALVVVGVTGCSETESAGGASQAPSTDASTSATPTDASAGFEELESRFDARLGVYAVDVGTGTDVAWREDERFAYASTIKALAAAALLDRLGIDGVEQQVPIEADDILPHSPVTETRVGGTMTLREIAKAAVTQSDNAAGNVLFEALGGPGALDAALTDLGDDVTSVSRIEPELNQAVPGDEQDTTTPRAIAGDLHEYVLGDTLTDDEAVLLKEWLTGSQTGDTLVRADLPTDWVVGDKSGAGGYASRADIAVIWPTEGAPIVIAVMSDRDEQDAEYDDRLVAEAAAAAVSALR